MDTWSDTDQHNYDVLSAAMDDWADKGNSYTTFGSRVPTMASERATRTGRNREGFRSERFAADEVVVNTVLMLRNRGHRLDAGDFRKAIYYMKETIREMDGATDGRQESAYGSVSTLWGRDISDVFVVSEGPLPDEDPGHGLAVAAPEPEVLEDIELYDLSKEDLVREIVRRAEEGDLSAVEAAADAALTAWADLQVEAEKKSSASQSSDKVVELVSALERVGGYVHGGRTDVLHLLPGRSDRWVSSAVNSAVELGAVAEVRTGACRGVSVRGVSVPARLSGASLDVVRVLGASGGKRFGSVVELRAQAGVSKAALYGTCLPDLEGCGLIVWTRKGRDKGIELTDEGREALARAEQGAD